MNQKHSTKNHELEILRLTDELQKEREKNKLLREQMETMRTTSTMEVIRLRSQVNYMEKLAKLGLWEYDAKKDKINVSDNWLKIHGLRAEEFDGSFEHFYSLVHPDDIETMKQNEKKSFVQKRSIPVMFRIIRNDREMRYLYSKAQMILDEHGEIERIYGFVSDVTKRKLREKALRRSKSLYKSLVNSLPIDIYRVDLKGRYTFVNHSFLHQLGIGSKEVLGKTAYDFYSPELAKEVQQNNAKVVEVGDTIFFTKETMVEGEGRKRFYEVIKLPVRNEQGVITGVQTVSWDVTERKKTEIALAESEQKFRSYIESAPIGVFVANREGKNLEMNPAAEVLTGYSAAELKGSNLMNIVYKHDRRKIAVHSKKLLETGKSATEIRIVKKSDKVAYWSVNTVRLSSNMYLGFVTDITERKKNEEAMKTSHWIFNHSTDMICLASFDGYFNVLNPVWEEVLGWSLNELMAKPFIEFVHPDDREATTNLNITLSSGKTVNQFENRYVCKDGSVKWLSWNSYPYKSEKVIFAVARDITEKVKMEVELHTTQLHFSDFLNSSINEISYWKVSNRFDFTNDLEQKVATLLHSQCMNCNEMFWKLSGSQGKTDVLGKELVEVLDVNLYKKVFTHFVRGGYHLNNFELWSSRPSGEDFCGLLSIHGVIKSKEFISIWMNIKDVTAQKKAEWQLQEQNKAYGLLNEKLSKTNQELLQLNQELTKAKQQAEESDRLKTAFLQNMSHEVRTPMNGIIGFSEMLRYPDIKAEKKEQYIQLIIESSTQLLSIVEDILDISRIETGQMKLSKEQVDINHLIMELFSFYTSRANTKSIMLFSNSNLPDEESVIYTDRTKVRQVLSNLIENALKFTQKGHIKFGYRLIQTPSLALEFFVEDTGIGIAPEKHEEIFERFMQADMSLTKQYGGTGLGLSICKGIVELLGGKIWVESQLNQGATFYFTLPYQPVNEFWLDKHMHHKSGPTSPYTILVVEDEGVNFMFAKELINEIISGDIDVIHAKNGLEAVWECKTNPQIKLILMDIKMPKMNGYEATESIRSFLPDLPIIALTAYATDEDRQKAFKAGCNDYISKPVKPSIIKPLIEQYLNFVDLSTNIQS